MQEPILLRGSDQCTVAWTFGPGRTCKGPGPGSDLYGDLQTGLDLQRSGTGVGPGSELEIRRSVQVWINEFYQLHPVEVSLP